jgi:hypothetical protein
MRLEAQFSSSGPEAEILQILLRLKGMEIYFGRERAETLARRLGLSRVPGDEEMREAGWVWATGVLLCT